MSDGDTASLRFFGSAPSRSLSRPLGGGGLVILLRVASLRLNAAVVVAAKCSSLIKARRRERLSEITMWFMAGSAKLSGCYYLKDFFKSSDFVGWGEKNSLSATF